MEFLAKQVDISKLTVVTKSGDKISASFNGMVSGSGNNDSQQLFKSIDALKSLASQEIDTAATGDPSKSTVYCEYYKAPTSLSDPFVSSEWQAEYGKNHVDVSYSNCFVSTSQQQKTDQNQSTALPPKKRGKADWQGMFDDALSPLVEAASIVKPQPVVADFAAAEILKSQKAAPTDSKMAPKQSKRKPRKVIPLYKDYISVYKDTDVLFGRGGRSNHHPGNKIYRDIVTERQPYYRKCDKNQKTRVAQSIVDLIQQHHHGRFLELDKEVNRWYIVPNIVSRRKVGQALRENNTEEARAAKREKYGQGKVKKTASVLA